MVICLVFQTGILEIYKERIGERVISSINQEIEEEKQRLEFIKKYMQVVIDTAETNKEQFMEKMKDIFKDEDWVESAGYSQLLTSASFYQLSRSELESLIKALPKPYFARVDFTSREAGGMEKLYFGKTSLFQRDNQEQLIIDWRSPIANLYYEGRLGEVSYTSEGETYDGTISLKRQFIIEDGELLDIRDIDVTTVDELLQESLAGSSANRLTEIVATIQEEQNQIIRADLNKPIIVQGAAGSGKTTIALHRISYFLYHYKDVFQPEQLLILAPSFLFLDYISEALPELGVEKVRQMTFQGYVEEVLGKKIKLTEDTKLRDILKDQQFVHISSIKGSSLFQGVLDHYVEEIKTSLMVHEDFRVDKFKLYTAKQFNHLLYNEYTYLPLYKRIEKLKKVLQNQVRLNKDKMLKKVVQHYEVRIDRALNWKGDEKKRKQYISLALDKKEARINDLKMEIKKAVQDYMSYFDKRDIWTLYKELYSDPDRLVQYSDHKLSKKEALELCESSKNIFSKKKYELEDLGPILYLYAKIYGVKPEKKAKNVVIDEAQDYSFLQLQGLKTALETDMFTLVGDLAQGIHSYRGITDWQEVRKSIFPRAIYRELKKSYRTTVEIMNEANQLLKRLSTSFPEVEPIIRHGKPPVFLEITSDEEWAEQLSNQVRKLKEEKFNTFAIITKTEEDAAIVNSILKQHTELDLYLLEETTSIPKDKIVIVPSYLAKGLEFDAVFAVTYNEVYSDNHEIDIKLLYVVMTRALHRLILMGKQKRAFIL